jgi:hypothetical protein
MRPKVLLFLPALLMTAACSMPSPIAPSNGPWRFSGTISAMDGSRIGGPIAGAELTVLDGLGGPKTRSDAFGHYVLVGLETGRFTVTIVAPGYVSATPIVDMYRDTDANFALEPQ